MDESTPELETIENLRDHLETLLKKPERALVNFLVNEGFIQRSVGEEVCDPKSRFTPREKAGTLVDAMVESIERDKNLFHVLVSKFNKSGKFYQSTAEKLSAEYAQRSGEGGEARGSVAQQQLPGGLQQQQQQAEREYFLTAQRGKRVRDLMANTATMSL